MRPVLSAGVVPVIPESEPLFLLLRVYKYWDFPKGEVEAGEDPLKTALRELKEETGIAGAGFEWGKIFKETEKYSGGKTARYYLARVNSKKCKLSREHHEFRWMTQKQAGKLLVPRVKKILDWAAEVIRT